MAPGSVWDESASADDEIRALLPETLGTAQTCDIPCAIGSVTFDMAYVY